MLDYVGLRRGGASGSERELTDRTSFQVLLVLETTASKLDQIENAAPSIQGSSDSESDVALSNSSDPLL
jgi:hypothetical protein